MSENKKPEETGKDTLLVERVEVLTSEVRRLTKLMEDLRLQQYIQALLNTRRIVWINLLAGIMNGLGAVIGATLVLTLLLFLLSRLEVVPVIGKFVSDIIKIVRQQPP